MFGCAVISKAGARNRKLRSYVRCAGLDRCRQVNGIVIVREARAENNVPVRHRNPGWIENVRYMEAVDGISRCGDLRNRAAAPQVQTAVTRPSGRARRAE